MKMKTDKQKKYADREVEKWEMRKERNKENLRQEVTILYIC